MDMKTKMGMKKILKLFLIYNFLTPALIAKEAQYCALNKMSFDKRVRVNDFPSYFFKVHPSGEYIAYINSSGNQLLNLNSGKNFRLPGIVDPVFSPDGKYILTPIIESSLEHGPMTYGENLIFTASLDIDGENKNGMSFYLFNDFKNAQENDQITKEEIKKLHTSPIFRDTESEGVYQSASIDPQNNSMMVITDQNRLSSKNYDLKDGDISSKGKLHSICDKVENFPTNLPMLSKDGRFISSFNERTKTTQIYELKSDGNCHLSLDLGLATGKVSFNKDSSQVAFHVDLFSTAAGSYFSGVASDISKDVYVVNLNESRDAHGLNLVPSTWAKVTNNQANGDGSFYPDFSNNGDLYFLNDSGNYFEFIQKKQDDLNFVNFYGVISSKEEYENSDGEIDACYKINKKNELNFILGQMWIDVCKKISNPTLTDSVLISMGLNKTNCEELVKSKWDDSVKEKIEGIYRKKVDLSFLKEVDLSDLLAACPKNNEESKKEKIVGQWLERSTQSLEETLQQKCMSCHSSPVSYSKEVTTINYYDENFKTVKTIKEMKKFAMKAIDPKNIDKVSASKFLDAITHANPNKRMPKGSQLSDDQYKTFMDYYILQSNDLGENESVGDEDSPSRKPMYSEAGLEKQLKENIALNEAYFKEYPEMKEAFIRSQRKEVWCNFGQLGCADLIKDKLNTKKEEITSLEEKLSDQEKEEVLKKYNRELKCNYNWNVTRSECKEFLNNSNEEYGF